MNERIQELAEQAGMYVDLDSKPGPKWMSAEESVAAYEKFAQLIVQKCAGIYSKIDNGNLHMGTDNYLEALHKTFRS